MYLGVLPLSWCWSGSALTAAPTPAASPAAAPVQSSQELDEVSVIGKKLYQIQRELVQAQDAFYGLYNELNTKRDFDIHCTFEAPTGTRIKKRECRLQFINDATAEQAQEMLAGLGSDPPRPANYVEPPELRWMRRQEEYRKNAREVLMSSQELRDLAQKWQDLQGEYDRASKRNRQKDAR
ncbi:MAG: hypothetical protein LBE59_06010 [Nevskiaceae bacterium]|jgi:hypothetical protein|nr:hypothetical protein [Nevskiaceae bacterium]